MVIHETIQISKLEDHINSSISHIKSLEIGTNGTVTEEYKRGCLESYHNMLRLVHEYKYTIRG